MADNDIGGLIGGTIGSSSLMLGSSVVDVCLGETSYELGSGRSDTFDTGSETMGDLGGVSSENPVGTTGVGMIISTGVASSGSSEDPDGIIIFFRKDSIPYSRVEKNAVSIFNMLHKNKKISFGKAAIITKTKKTYEYFRKLFCTSNNYLDIDEIAVIEGVLDRIANE